MKEVRTRFAPSPTGFLHVGGVRTALFAWLLAKKHGGKFILRVEDTDQQRLVPGAIRAIIEDLRWLGVEPDEGPSTEELLRADPSLTGLNGIGGSKGPYIQSQRLARYQEVAEELIRLGVAYRSETAADATWMERKGKPVTKPVQVAAEDDEEDLGEAAHQDEHPQEGQPGKAAIRLRIPKHEILSVKDAIRGEIRWQSLSLNDPVLLKGDGFPTYHLAVVVDDHDMQISHVLRGEEWIPSTPIHLLIYKALGWEPPTFAHPASVLGEDGKKLSKRHGATNVSAFRESGYMPEALLNFLVLIGWAPGEGEKREIFTKEELAKLFSFDHVNSAAGIFAYDKLNWMNAQYLRALPDKELAARFLPFLQRDGLTISSPKDLELLDFITPHIKERVERLDQAAPLLELLFKEPFERELSLIFSKHIGKEKAVAILDKAAEKLQSLANFSGPEIDAALRAVVSELGLPMGGVFITVRIAVTGKKITPPLIESILALGQTETLKRLREARPLIEAYTA